MVNYFYVQALVWAWNFFAGNQVEKHAGGGFAKIFQRLACRNYFAVQIIVNVAVVKGGKYKVFGIAFYGFYCIQNFQHKFFAGG